MARVARVTMMVRVALWEWPQKAQLARTVLLLQRGVGEVGESCWWWGSVRCTTTEICSMKMMSLS